MAQFEKKKIDLTQINGGNRYENGDGVQAETINAVVEASAFAQSLVTNAPDISEIANETVPSFSIEGVEEGNPHIKVVGLKGKNGEKGERGEMGITPQLRINESTNYWEISYDNGLTWASLGVIATGGATNIANGEGEYSLVMNDGLNTATGDGATTLGDNNKNEGRKCLINGTQNQVLVDGAETPPNSCEIGGQLNIVRRKVMCADVSGRENIVEDCNNVRMSGLNNHTNANGTDTSGQSNINDGATSIMSGIKNANYATAALLTGTGNVNNPNKLSNRGEFSTIGGRDNKNSSRASTTGGRNCTNNGTGVGWYGNILHGYWLLLNSHTHGEAIFGHYNLPNSDALFSLGNGYAVTKSEYTSAEELIGLWYVDSDNTPIKITADNAQEIFDNADITSLQVRQNAFEALLDGRVKVFGAPMDDNDVVRYGDIKNLGGGSSIEVDETLTVTGAAADAKTVGEKFTEVNEKINELEGATGGLEIVRLY